MLFLTFLSTRLIFAALSLGLLALHHITSSLSLTPSSRCGSLFSLAFLSVALSSNKILPSLLQVWVCDHLYRLGALIRLSRGVLVA